MLRRFIIKLAFVALAMLASTRTVFAGKKVYIGESVSSDKQVSMDTVDHQPWDAILRKYVDKDGMVNYRSLKADETDLRTLDAYLQSLSSANVTQPAKRESQLAFWINAYNAVTVRGMLREYPTKSIRNHTSKFGGYNIWHDFQLRVGGKTYSLDFIEHKILRKLNEPRIHFAIVCASIGCPRLLNEAYTPDRLNEQLETNAKDFFARSQNFRHDQRKGRFYLSAILSWFGDDFGSSDAKQLKAIATWLPTVEARKAARQNTVSVKYLDYDWNINEQTSAAKRVTQ